MDEISPDNKKISQVSPTPKPRNLPSRSSGIPGEFGSILDGHLESGTQGETVDRGGLPELEATYAAKCAEISLAGPRIPDRISDTLDLLEGYARNLADPGTPLKQAYALLEQVMSRTETIGKDLKSSPDRDPRLEEIVAHLSTVVELEKIKMERGDYS